MIKEWNSLKNNLLLEIGYYEDLFSTTPFFENTKNEIFSQFNSYKMQLNQIEIPELKLA